MTKKKKKEVILIDVAYGHNEQKSSVLRVIICKDQAETENFDSGVLKISSYSHMLVITWY